MEAVGVEPTSENISIRLSPSAGHILSFALNTAYVQAVISAISNCSTWGRRTPQAVPWFRWCPNLTYRSVKRDKLAAYAANAKLLFSFAFNLIATFNVVQRNDSLILLLYPRRNHLRPRNKFLIALSLHPSFSIFFSNCITFIVILLTFCWWNFHFYKTIF